MPADESPLYLPAGEREPVAGSEVLAVILVVNGSVGMSPGKVASQCFQGCLALLEAAQASPTRTKLLEDWQRQGWRTIVRMAETEGLFQRVLQECEGVVLRDEGLTEVADGTPTVFVSYPVLRGETPKILSHKRVGLL